jgi:hypothetical protein
MSALTGIGRLVDDQDELTMSEVGLWVALSQTSAHLFDLDAGRVFRMPGFLAVEYLAVPGRDLRSIDVCRVGERGEWTMYPLGGKHVVGLTWHLSTEITRIARVDGLFRLGGDSMVSRAGESATGILVEAVALNDAGAVRRPRGAVGAEER